MKQFLLLMHRDFVNKKVAEDPAGWGDYLKKLRGTGQFEGGSELANGEVFRKDGAPAAMTSSVDGFIQIRAESLNDLRALIEGNPVYEAGGSIEVREMPQDG